MVTFLHTADWQLGKPFAAFQDPQKRALVQRERLNALQRIAAVARSERVAFVLVAGDLFDSPSTPKPVVSAACAAIGAMDVPVFAIPGNHDHGGAGTVWEQPFFQQEKKALAPNLTVLLETAPCELASAVLFPCPALRRHESADAAGWLRASSDCESFGDKPRIVIGHGSVQGFGMEPPDDGREGACRNRIDLGFVSEDRFDYVALGDWHGTKQVGPSAWYSGTPEPDRFSRGPNNLPGHVLVVTAGRGTAPRVKIVRTGRLGWHRVEFEFSSDDDLSRLEALVDNLIGARVQEDALFLELRGVVGLAARSRLEQRLEAWNARLLRVHLDDRTVIEPTTSELEGLTGRTADPLIARVATKLIGQSGTSGEAAAVARVALRELHALCQEV